MSKSEPGKPTWPSRMVTGCWASAAAGESPRVVTAMPRTTDSFASFIISSLIVLFQRAGCFCVDSGGGALGLRAALCQICHGRLDALLLHRHAGEPKAHLYPGERAHQHEIVEIAEVADAE